MSYQGLIKKADHCELKGEYSNAIYFLEKALTCKQSGSVTKKSVKERIKELELKLKL